MDSTSNSTGEKTHPYFPLQEVYAFCPLRVGMCSLIIKRDQQSQHPQQRKGSSALHGTQAVAVYEEDCSVRKLQRTHLLMYCLIYALPWGIQC